MHDSMVSALFLWVTVLHGIAANDMFLLKKTGHTTCFSLTSRIAKLSVWLCLRGEAWSKNSDTWVRVPACFHLICDIICMAVFWAVCSDLMNVAPVVMLRLGVRVPGGVCGCVWNASGMFRVDPTVSTLPTEKHRSEESRISDEICENVRAKKNSLGFLKDIFKGIHHMPGKNVA